MNAFEACISFIERDGRAVLINIAEVKGSAPREAGTAMAVAVDGRHSGTIGGGELEWQALAMARRLLAGDTALLERSIVLGPELGQCCGGQVRLRLEMTSAADIAQLRRRADEVLNQRSKVAIFGAGHVGRALVLALAPLPFAVRWIDGRQNVFPGHVPGNVICENSDSVDGGVASLAPSSLLVIATHDHALDLALVRAALLRRDLAFVGLIGSASKKARFRGRLAAAGIDDRQFERLTCPIGATRLRSKEPSVIAAGIAVQLLEQHERQHGLCPPQAVMEGRRHSMSLAMVDE